MSIAPGCKALPGLPPAGACTSSTEIRTNNDVEGWHNGLNKRASGRAQITLYMLINLLHKEACLVALQIRLVSEQKLTKLQEKKYRSVQGKVLSYWEQYACHQKSAAQLLKACYHAKPFKINYDNGLSLFIVTVRF